MKYNTIKCPYCKHEYSYFYIPTQLNDEFSLYCLKCERQMHVFVQKMNVKFQTDTYTFELEKLKEEKNNEK